MHLGRTQRQIAGDLGNRRTPAAVAHQLGEHDHVLGQQALRQPPFSSTAKSPSGPNCPLFVYRFRTSVIAAAHATGSEATLCEGVADSGLQAAVIK
jgi:hypothetical protein